jgi:hypothetical protein
MTTALSSSPLLLDASAFPTGCRATPKAAPRHWGTAMGSWGDCLIALGTFRHLVGRGGLLLWAQDPAIEQFARAQNFVEDVRFVPFPRTEENIALYGKVCDEGYGPDTEPWRKVFNESTVPDFAALSGQGRVTPTHIDTELAKRRQAFHWHGARLPLSTNGEVYWFIENHEIPDGFVLLQPYSINSSSLEQHWPHWQEALEYLLRYTPYTYVVVGTGWKCEVARHPRLINLEDCTSSMLEVFALAERARAVITTSNCLSHYAVIQNLPAVVVGNAPLSNPDSYFRRWLQADDINLVEFEATPADFIRIANRIL